MSGARMSHSVRADTGVCGWSKQSADEPPRSPRAYLEKSSRTAPGCTMTIDKLPGRRPMRESLHLVTGAQRETGVGKGRTGGMAILEPELRSILGDLPSVVVDQRDRRTTLSRRVGTATQVHRHALIRLLVADTAGLVLAAFLGPFVFWALSSDTPGHLSSIFLFNLAMIPLFLGLFSIYGLYRGVTRRITKSVFADLRNVLHSLMISGFLYAIVAYVATKDFGFQGLSVAKIAAMCVAAVIAVPLTRAVSFSLLGRASVGSLPIIVVGTGKLAQTVASHLRAHSSVNFIGFVDDDPLGHGDVIGELDDLPELCRRYSVARVVVCFSKTHPERMTEMLKSLAGEVGVSIVPRYYELITLRSHVDDLSGLPMLDIAPASLSAGARFLKRSSDIVVSSLILLAVSPLFLVIAFMIKMTSAGPIFFRQERTGQDEETFSMLKFRTMYEDAESMRHEMAHLNEVDGPLFKVQNDPPRHSSRSILAPDQSRRAPAAHQRLEGRHVARGSTAIRRIRSPHDRRVGAQTLRGTPGDDRSMASFGSERAVPPRAMSPRLSLCRLVVVLVGHAHPLENARHDFWRAGSLLGLLRRQGESGRRPLPPLHEVGNALHRASLAAFGKARLAWC